VIPHPRMVVCPNHRCSSFGVSPSVSMSMCRFAPVAAVTATSIPTPQRSLVRESAADPTQIPCSPRSAWPEPSFPRAHRRSRRCSSAGGTPTLLPAEHLGVILKEIGNEFGLAPDAEVTTEANPESVTPSYLAKLRDSGFTRISLGMQSAITARARRP